MSDLVRRKDAIKCIEGYGLSNGSVLGRHSGIADCILSTIERLPTIDAVPVVRCKDCKYWEKVEYYPDGTKDVCRLLKRQTQDDCFCSCGERKNCGKINARMPEAAGRTSERAVKTNGEDECAGNS